MPREIQKRGRREDKKRKLTELQESPATKRQNSQEDEDSDVEIIVDGDVGADHISFSTRPGPAETPFYGLLDQEEQDYFTRANEMLDLDQFPNAEERGLFLETVYREANGKELQIACSQGCSRVMEKLLTMSTTDQLKTIFQKFGGHFLHLVQHRFASHCCETLFIQAAVVVTSEMNATTKQQQRESNEYGNDLVLMEDHFLQVVQELEGNLGYLLTERFASHVIRILLVVLSGEPLDQASIMSFSARRKKESVHLGQDGRLQTRSESRVVPESFGLALEKIIDGAVSSLDMTYLRALATHPTGNPVLQLLLSLELKRSGKSKAKDRDSIMRRLLPDEQLQEGSDSASFVNGLMYDPVGSRLLETIVQQAPGKTFKSIYRTLIKDRMNVFAKNETAAYVVIRVVERLGKEDLENAVNLILPETAILVDRSRLSVIKVLIERCVARGVDTTQIAEALEAAYGDDPSGRLQRMLKLERLEEEQPKKQNKQSNYTSKNPVEGRHGSLLAQAMLHVDGPLSDLVSESLLAANSSTLLLIAKDPTASHVLQESLTLPISTKQFRRKIVPNFFGHLAELSLDTSGSHVADALWHATQDLKFLKERFAQELLENEAVLQDSFFGRAVWRNWSMWFYKKHGNWPVKAKDSDIQHQSEEVCGADEKPQSAIDVARARFAERKRQAGKGTEGRALVSTNT